MKGEVIEANSLAVVAGALVLMVRLAREPVSSFRRTSIHP